MTSAPIGDTAPHAGVIATNAAMSPDAAPREVGRGRGGFADVQLGDQHGKAKAADLSEEGGEGLWPEGPRQLQMRLDAHRVDRHAPVHQIPQQGQQAPALLGGVRRVLLHPVFVQRQAQRGVALPRHAERRLDIAGA